MNGQTIGTEEILKDLPMGILVASDSGELMMHNEKAVQLLRISIEDLLIKGIRDLIPAKEFHDAFELAKEGNIKSHSFSAKMEDIELGFTVTRCKGASDAQNFILIAVEDVTKYRQMEKIKQEFIETILHRIRNPLSTLKTTLSILNSSAFEGLPANAKEILSMGYRETNRLHFFLNDLRDLFYVETGRAEKEMALECFEVTQAMGQAIEELCKLPWPFEGIKKRLDIGGNLDLAIRADFEKTKQVFFTLLKNAVRYSPEPAAITIGISQKVGYASITVRDRGMGISDPCKPHVFSKFFREDNAVNREIHGSGLGLFIAKSFVKLMNGSIYCESEKGKGSAFTVSLPLATR